MDKLWKTPVISVDNFVDNLWVSCGKNFFLSYPQNNPQVIHWVIHKDIHRHFSLDPLSDKVFEKKWCKKRLPLLSTIYNK